MHFTKIAKSEKLARARRYSSDNVDEPAAQLEAVTHVNIVWMCQFHILDFLSAQIPHLQAAAMNFALVGSN